MQLKDQDQSFEIWSTVIVLFMICSHKWSGRLSPINHRLKRGRGSLCSTFCAQEGLPSLNLTGGDCHNHFSCWWVATVLLFAPSFKVVGGICSVSIPSFWWLRGWGSRRRGKLRRQQLPLRWDSEISWKGSHPSNPQKTHRNTSVPYFFSLLYGESFKFLKPYNYTC